jgi:hypothetical protein
MTWEIFFLRNFFTKNTALITHVSLLQLNPDERLVRISAGTQVILTEVSRLSSVTPGKFRDNTSTGIDPFLPNPFQFIILVSEN